MRMSYKKGKDVKKKSKLGMVSVNLGLDKNKDVTQADIKGKFIARKKAMGGGMMRKEFGKGGGAGLYANIAAKKARIKAGSKEKMRKKGAKGAATAKNFKRAKQTART